MCCNEFEKRKSNSIYYTKVLAILSVIAAHVIELEDTSLILCLITRSWKIYGLVGVVIFFIWAGYFSEKVDLSLKFKKLIIPWVFSGIFTYVIEVLINHNFTITGYFKWILGYGTFYYYLTIYMLLLWFSKYLWENTFLLNGSIVLTCTFLLLASAKINLVTNPYLSTYLNPFNWIGYFALGIAIKKYKIDETWLGAKKRFVIYIFIVEVLLVTGMLYFEIFTYFNILSGLFEITTFFLIWRICFSIENAFLLIQRNLMYIGKNTLFIYLFHIQIVQFICHRIPVLWIRAFLSPIIGLFVMVIGLYVIRYIVKNKIIKKLSTTLLGINLKYN